MHAGKSKKGILGRFIPGLPLIHTLRTPEGRKDFIPAITVFAVMVPSAMAYGELAGVSPVAGLYVALAAMAAYAFFGSSKQIVMGPDATAAIMTAAAIGPLAGGDMGRYMTLAALLAILVGVVSLIGRLAKLGFITDFLSKPILVGYVFGTALIGIGSQLGKMLGISIESDEFFGQVYEFITRFHEGNTLTITIGIVSIIALFTMRRVSKTLPGPLIVVVLAIITSVVFGLQEKGVKIVGAVPAGLPSFTVPAIATGDIFLLLPAAISLTILIYADQILNARVFAAKHGQKLDANQEFVGIGMANIAAGFLNGFPAATSASRTIVADQMGGKTQLVGLTAAALTIVFLLFFTPLLAPLPLVVLGAIIIVASFGLLDAKSFLFLRRVRKVEFRLAIITLFGVLTLGILQGVLVAVTLSLINVLYRIARPHDAVLDEVNIRGGTVYRDVSNVRKFAMTEPGLIVYRFDAPLVFANSAYFIERLEKLIKGAGRSLRCVILDAEAISDFDSTAAETLENLNNDLDRRGVDLWVARANEPLIELFEVTGLTKKISAENIFPSVKAAVLAYRKIARG